MLKSRCRANIQHELAVAFGSVIGRPETDMGQGQSGPALRRRRRCDAGDVGAVRRRRSVHPAGHSSQRELRRAPSWRSGRPRGAHGQEVVVEVESFNTPSANAADAAKWASST